MGYVLLAGFAFFTALLFTVICLRGLNADYSQVLDATSVIFLIYIPLLTMRVFAEEAAQKTDQLLFTAPLRIWRVVLGKFLAAFLFFATCMGVTLVFPLALSFFGKIPVPAITGAFLGYTLLGAAFVAVGVFMSSLSGSQIIAAFTTFGALFVLYLLGAIKAIVPSDTMSSVIFVCVLLAFLSYLLFDATRSLAAGAGLCLAGLIAVVATALKNRNMYEGLIVKFLDFFAVTARFENFAGGILSVSDIVYYLSFTAAFLFFTVNAAEKRRWR
jgi:ABC-2 type transport system permease protein